jgi:mannose-6-phosphate isomerase-like protein (cupin superfamily)
MSGYRTVSVDDVPNTPSPAREKKEVDEAVGATEFGFNAYAAEPGEEIPWGYHRHPDHEELFYVLSGRLAFETPEGEFRVGPGEAFFVPRDHPNKARVVGDAPARFIAVGAPKASDEAIIEEECHACGEVADREYAVESGGGTEMYVLTCAACGAETKRFD